MDVVDIGKVLEIRLPASRKYEQEDVKKKKEKTPASSSWYHNVPPNDKEKPLVSRNP